MTRLRKLALITSAWGCLLAAARPAMAQAVCTVSSQVAPVRSEGLAEVLGSMAFACTGVAASPASITVTLSGAPLAPSALVPDNLTSFPLPALTSTAAFAVGPVVTFGATSVTFGYTPSAGAQTFLLSGLRANVAASGLPVGGQITATLSTSALTLTRVTASIGIVANGLGVGSGFPDSPLNIFVCSQAVPTPAGAPDTVAGNPDPSVLAANSLRVRFVEGFPSAFVTAANEDARNGGLQGTRFRILLTGIPSGIVPYAPRAIGPTSLAATGAVTPGATALRRVDAANADGSGGTVLADVPNQFDKIRVSGGIATIFYEVTADSPQTLDTITLFIALTSDGTLTPGIVNEAISLAPLGPSPAAPARPQFALSTAMSFSASALTFVSIVGTTPAVQGLQVSNSGVGVLHWTATISSITGGDWLTLSPSSGTGGTELLASATSAALPVGTYSASITFASAEAVNSPQTVPVMLVVLPTPALDLFPSEMHFHGTPTSHPDPQLLWIASNVAPTNWTTAAETAAGGAWLSVSPASGAGNAFATIRVDTTGLAVGRYEGRIVVSSNDVPNSPQILPVFLTVEGAEIGLRPASLQFTTSAEENPAPQTFTVENAGAGVLGWAASTSTQSGGNWLSVSPAAAVAPSTVAVTVSTQGLAPGTYQGTVSVAAIPSVASANSPQLLGVSLVIGAPAAPRIDQILNAASFSSEAISPGLIAALFGAGLASTTAVATSSAGLPTSLADTQVLVNGFPAPLFFVSSRQINFLVPVDLSGSSAEIVVVSGGIRGAAKSVRVAPETPGIFTVPPGGQGAIVNEDGTLNSAGNPAQSGSVVQIYAAGLGVVGPQPSSGQPAATSPLSRTKQSPLVWIGGVSAEVLYSGLAPGFVGLYQINAKIPPSAPSGSAWPLQVQIGAGSSNVVTIAIH